MFIKLFHLLLFTGLNCWLGFGQNIEIKDNKSVKYQKNFRKNKEVKNVIIGGNIFNDPDGGNVNNSTGLTNSIPNNIYASLVNSSGTVIESVLVLTSGSFTFSSIAEDEYLVLISINQGNPTEPSPIVELPAGWSNTGEFNGPPDSGIDSQIDGTSELINITSDYSFFNFGIKSATALPIDLISFTGNIFQNQIKLTWKVANESNFSHFEIERSIDASAFEKIGKVNSTNEISEAINYDYFDKQTKNYKLIYYRLKMVDLDGKFKFSKVIFVKFDEIIAHILVENPVQNAQFKVFANLDKPLFSLINSTGNRVETSFSEEKNGVFHIKLQDASPGIYFLIIEVDNQIFTRKIIAQ
jgi:hypothetical protein